MPRRLSDLVASWVRRLSADRPLFHSEIDFQLALSRVMIADGVNRVRLERRIELPELLHDRAHPEIDIVARLGDEFRIALELKYPKRELAAEDVMSDGEPESFHLRASGAPDRDACAIWHDAERIEALLRHRVVNAGVVVALSNYAFWKSTSLKEGTKAHAFRLWHEPRRRREQIGIDHDEPDQSPPQPARPTRATSAQSSRTTVRLEDGAIPLTCSFATALCWRGGSSGILNGDFVFREVWIEC